MRKFRTTIFAVALCAGLSASALSFAQTWPSKPIQWVVGFPPGVAPISSRVPSPDKISASIGQNIVVDNRPGASSIIAAQVVAQAAPDGYTVFGADGGALVLNPALYSKLPYDPVRDFAPVSLLIKAPLLIAVHPSFPAKDIKSFIELARAQPGKLNYASPGRGTHHHLAMETLKARTGIDVADIVYKGRTGGAEVLAGQVMVGMLDSVVTLSHLRAGKLRALAVFSATRIPQLPDVPTLMELGLLDQEVAATVGVVAPRATPRDVVAKLASEAARAVKHPELNKRLSDLGMEPVGSSPEQFSAYLESEAKLFQPLIRRLNIRLD